MSSHTFSAQTATYEVELIAFRFSSSPAEQNADFFLRRSTGERYAGVVATTQNIAHLFARADGVHWVAIKGLVIVPEFTARAIFLAIEHLVRDEAHTWALVRQSDDDQTDS